MKKLLLLLLSSYAAFISARGVFGSKPPCIIAFRDDVVFYTKCPNDSSLILLEYKDFKEEADKLNVSLIPRMFTQGKWSLPEPLMTKFNNLKRKVKKKAAEIGRKLYPRHPRNQVVIVWNFDRSFPFGPNDDITEQLIKELNDDYLIEKRLQA